MFLIKTLREYLYDRNRLEINLYVIALHCVLPLISSYITKIKTNKIHFI